MSSKLEDKFLSKWNQLYPALPLIPEYYFCKPRRFRADFAHVETMTLIDIQGGVWMGGKSKHSSGVGITRDCEKLFLANTNGFAMFYLTSNMIADESNQYLKGIAHFIISQLVKVRHSA